MQFKTKRGLVDIPNAEVLAAANILIGAHLLSEMALHLCRVIEAQPACEGQTKCSLLASDLRRALEDYEQTRPLTPEENDAIAAASKRHFAVPINPNR